MPIDAFPTPDDDISPYPPFYCDVCSLEVGVDTCGPCDICHLCARYSCAHCHRPYLCFQDSESHLYCDLCRERDLEGRTLRQEFPAPKYAVYLCEDCEHYYYTLADKPHGCPYHSVYSN